MRVARFNEELRMMNEELVLCPMRMSRFSYHSALKLATNRQILICLSKSQELNEYNPVIF